MCGVARRCAEAKLCNATTTQVCDHGFPGAPQSTSARAAILETLGWALESLESRLRTAESRPLEITDITDFCLKESTRARRRAAGSWVGSWVGSCVGRGLESGGSPGTRGGGGCRLDQRLKFLLYRGLLLQLKLECLSTAARLSRRRELCGVGLSGARRGPAVRSCRPRNIQGRPPYICVSSPPHHKGVFGARLISPPARRPSDEEQETVRERSE